MDHPNSVMLQSCRAVTDTIAQQDASIQVQPSGIGSSRVQAGRSARPNHNENVETHTLRGMPQLAHAQPRAPTRDASGAHPGIRTGGQPPSAFGLGQMREPQPVAGVLDLEKYSQPRQPDSEAVAASALPVPAAAMMPLAQPGLTGLQPPLASSGGRGAPGSAVAPTKVLMLRSPGALDSSGALESVALVDPSKIKATGLLPGPPWRPLSGCSPAAASMLGGGKPTSPPYMYGGVLYGGIAANGLRSDGGGVPPPPLPPPPPMQTQSASSGGPPGSAAGHRGGGKESGGGAGGEAERTLVPAPAAADGSGTSAAVPAAPASLPAGDVIMRDAFNSTDAAAVSTGRECGLAKGPQPGMEPAPAAVAVVAAHTPASASRAAAASPRKPAPSAKAPAGKAAAKAAAAAAVEAFGNLPPPVAVQVASRSKRKNETGAGGKAGTGSKGASRDGITRGAVGLFHPRLYLTGGDCIKCGSEMMSRGRFEKLAGTATAKWHVSIKVLPSGITLGRWLQQHGLPILQGRPRKRQPSATAADTADEDEEEETEETEDERAGSTPSQLSSHLNTTAVGVAGLQLSRDQDRDRNQIRDQEMDPEHILDLELPDAWSRPKPAEAGGGGQADGRSSLGPGLRPASPVVILDGAAAEAPASAAGSCRAGEKPLESQRQPPQQQEPLQQQPSGQQPQQGQGHHDHEMQWQQQPQQQYPQQPQCEQAWQAPPHQRSAASWGTREGPSAGFEPHSDDGAFLRFLESSGVLQGQGQGPGGATPQSAAALPVAGSAYEAAGGSGGAAAAAPVAAAAAPPGGTGAPAAAGPDAASAAQLCGGNGVAPSRGGWSLGGSQARPVPPGIGGADGITSVCPVDAEKLFPLGSFVSRPSRFFAQHLRPLSGFGGGGGDGGVLSPFSTPAGPPDGAALAGAVDGSATEVARPGPAPNDAAGGPWGGAGPAPRREQSLLAAPLPPLPLPGLPVSSRPPPGPGPGQTAGPSLRDDGGALLGGRTSGSCPGEGPGGQAAMAATLLSGGGGCRGMGSPDSGTSSSEYPQLRAVREAAVVTDAAITLTSGMDSRDGHTAGTTGCYGPEVGGLCGWDRDVAAAGAGGRGSGLAAAAGVAAPPYSSTRQPDPLDRLSLPNGGAGGVTRSQAEAFAHAYAHAYAQAFAHAYAQAGPISSCGSGSHGGSHNTSMFLTTSTRDDILFRSSSSPLNTWESINPRTAPPPLTQCGSGPPPCMEMREAPPLDLSQDGFNSRPGGASRREEDPWAAARAADAQLALAREEAAVGGQLAGGLGYDRCDRGPAAAAAARSSGDGWRPPSMSLHAPALQPPQGVAGLGGRAMPPLPPRPEPPPPSQAQQHLPQQPYFPGPHPGVQEQLSGRRAMTDPRVHRGQGLLQGILSRPQALPPCSGTLGGAWEQGPGQGQGQSQLQRPLMQAQQAPLRQQPLHHQQQQQPSQHLQQQPQFNHQQQPAHPHQQQDHHHHHLNLGPPQQQELQRQPLLPPSHHQPHLFHHHQQQQQPQPFQRHPPRPELLQPAPHWGHLGGEAWGLGL